MSTALERLRSLLREQGGLMASLLSDDAPEAEGVEPIPAAPAAREVVATAPSTNGSAPAQIAALGPRTRARGNEYELLMEAIYEGYLLHYGAPRIVRPPEADLGLLAGDQLYALGLARLVALGDMEAVTELADVITLTALAQGAGHCELAQAVWAAGARAVGWGSSDLHRRAKALARAGEAGALEAMRAAAEPDEH